MIATVIAVQEKFVASERAERAVLQEQSRKHSRSSYSLSSDQTT